MNLGIGCVCLLRLESELPHLSADNPRCIQSGVTRDSVYTFSGCTSDCDCDMSSTCSSRLEQFDFERVYNAVIGGLNKHR